MFEGFDAVVLARAQFAFTMSFHIVFPAFSIGLASYLAVLEALWLWTGREVFINLFHYWLKIFAVAFGMGVVSGIVMAYQFGTNWSVFSDKTGPVIGPLMAYEVLTAFFLEAGFLGVMLFGLQRVGPRLHFLATLMVAIGTVISAFWILSANSWMQTPAGYAINESGQFVAASWIEVIFNPSFPYRLVHMVLAAYLTTALVVGAVGAYHLSRDQHLAGPRVMFSMAMWMATLVAPIQILAGDQHGLNTLEHQPTKIMAMEGHFESHKDGAPLILFGWPERESGQDGICGRGAETGIADPQAFPRRAAGRSRHRAARRLAAGADHVLGVPHHGRPRIPDDGARPVEPVDALARHGSINRACCTCSRWRWGPAGFVAVLAGWVTTETGRQPFTVYGLLRTVDSASPLAAPAVGSSLVGFVIVYFAVFAAGVVYLLRLMAAPPHPGEQGPSQRCPARAAGITPAARCDPGGPPMNLAIDLTILWAFIIAFAVFVYVVMDGFDLGLGILFPLFPERRDRDVIMNSVAPVWDGNETWLVLGGGGLMAAFPLAYAMLMPALYTPIIAMLLGLVFRGVAFEFRWHSQRERNRWDLAFTGGSLVAALAQGIALGAILQGVHVEGRQYAGGWWDWLTPFSILTGAALVIGYALLGATWLVMKTEGSLRDRAYHLSWVLLIAMLGAIGAVSIATPFLACAIHPSLVCLAEHHPHRAGADRGGRRDGAAAAQPRQQIRLPAVLPGAGAVRAVLCRASASACTPTSCRRASRSGRRPRRRTARSSCWSASQC